MALGLVGCPPSDSFICQTDAQCVHDGNTGTCQPNSYCSFPDSDCPSGERYGDHAADFSGRCVVDRGETDGVGDTDASTAGVTTGSGTSTTSTAEGSSSAGGDETTASTESGESGDNPEPMTLQNHNGQCEVGNGVACLSSGVVVGDNTTQECFTSPLDPPFSLTSTRYFVGDVVDELTEVRVQVRAAVDGAPSEDEVLFEAPLELAETSPGWHTFVFPAPVELMDATFCVGIVAPEDGPEGGVGISTDSDSALVTGVSHFRSTRCDLETFVDLISLEQVHPQKGNWCIDVEVQAQ